MVFGGTPVVQKSIAKMALLDVDTSPDCTIHPKPRRSPYSVFIVCCPWWFTPSGEPQFV